MTIDLEIVSCLQHLMNFKKKITKFVAQSFLVKIKIVRVLLECVYLTIPDHLADTKPHPNQSLDFS